MLPEAADGAVQGEVWRLAATLRTAADADDVAQEALLRVVRALPSFEGRSRSRTTAETCQSPVSPYVATRSVSAP